MKKEEKEKKKKEKEEKKKKENDNQKEITSEIKNPIITNSNENDEEKEINENEEEEEEINEQKLKNSENSVNSMTKPFISLASLSRCQCCNSEFNSNENLPILLQCSHFFCKKCLETYFIEENIGIKCPIDGVIAKNFEELVEKLKTKNNELQELVNYSKELQVDKFESENKIINYNNKIKKFNDEINSIIEKYKYNKKELDN